MKATLDELLNEADALNLHIIMETRWHNSETHRFTVTVACRTATGSEAFRSVMGHSSVDFADALSDALKNYEAKAAMKLLEKGVKV